MDKRQFLKLFFVLPMLTYSSLGVTHTPYRQWKVMRQRYLLVHSYRTNMKTDSLADTIVERLNRLLPESKSRVARARNAQRVGSLITTGQAVLAVMENGDALNLYKGKSQFRGLKKHAIRSIITEGNMSLVASISFPKHHAWLVTAALLDDKDESVYVPSSEHFDDLLPMHDGVIEYLKGTHLEDLQ